MLTDRNVICFIMLLFKMGRGSYAARGRCFLREALDVQKPGGRRNSARVSEIEVLRP